MRHYTLLPRSSRVNEPALPAAQPSMRCLIDILLVLRSTSRISWSLSLHELYGLSLGDSTGEPDTMQDREGKARELIGLWTRGISNMLSLLRLCRGGGRKCCSPLYSGDRSLDRTKERGKSDVEGNFLVWLRNGRGLIAFFLML